MARKDDPPRNRNRSARRVAVTIDDDLAPALADARNLLDEGGTVLSMDRLLRRLLKDWVDQPPEVRRKRADPVFIKSAALLDQADDHWTQGNWALASLRYADVLKGELDAEARRRCRYRLGRSARHIASDAMDRASSRSASPCRPACSRSWPNSSASSVRERSSAVMMLDSSSFSSGVM